MSFFTPSSSYLGVDVDSHSIKLVELKNDKGRPLLVTYGFFDYDIDRSVQQGANTLKEAGILIREVANRAKTSSKVCISALPAFSVFSSIITMPEMTKKELASAIRWEAKKVIPLPVEEMNLHWDMLIEGQEKKEEGEKVREDSTGFLNYHGFLKIARKKGAKATRILLTAAPKNLVKKYIEIFQYAGLNLMSLDTEAFALVRSLVGYDQSTLMIVDIDFSVSNIMIIQGGVPYLNRSINVGGITITQAIANSLNINLKRAEQFKYDIGLSLSDSGNSDIPNTVKNALSPIIDEIQYSINLYKSQGRPQIEKIILTGGSSLLNNLPAYLTSALEMKVFLGDPWARVMYPEELKPVLDEIGPRFSVAIGLAMKLIK